MNIEIVLCSVIVAQQLFFMWQIQKLVDKAMSRSYTEYIRATEKRPQIQLPQDLPEDLGPLQELSTF